MAANSAASLAEEMSRFEEEIGGSGPSPGIAPPPMSVPKTAGMSTQAMMTGPPPGFPPGPFMMPVRPPPMMAMPGPIGPPGVPGTSMPSGMPVPPGTTMPMPMPGMPPPMMPPPMGQMPFMVPMPMPVPMAGAAAGVMSTAATSAAGTSGMPSTLSEEQKREWESQFGKEASGKSKKKQKKNVRVAAGVTWVDSTLDEWDENDFRIFAGDLGHECTDEVLFRAFSKYPSLKKCKVVRDSRTNKSRGFGFVSFKDPKDYLCAIREMNGKYVAGRPIKLRKSTWKDRQLTVARRKQKEKERLGLK